MNIHLTKLWVPQMIGQETADSTPVHPSTAVETEIASAFGPLRNSYAVVMGEGARETMHGVIYPEGIQAAK